MKSNSLRRPLSHFVAISAILLLLASGSFPAQATDLAALEAAAVAKAPPPGSVYRECALHNGGNQNWRVTDPNARPERAKRHLPNPIHELTIDDLEHAVRAQALIDRWGGHTNTTSNRIRFNGNAWILVPELETTPPGIPPEKFLFQDNPIVEVPLADLKEGVNTLEATCGVIENYQWGQWGMYSVILRVYYNPEIKLHVNGRISSIAYSANKPEEGVIPYGEERRISDHPAIEVSVEDAAQTERVDVLAVHENYDVNGDGVYREWVRSYHQYPERGSPAVIRDHVGTATDPLESSFSVHWDTTWVPDQTPKSIQLSARILGKNGLWYVTPVIDNIGFGEREYSVRMFTASDVPTKFSSRQGNPKSCTIFIPEDVDFSKAVDAILHLRTWEGEDPKHRPMRINEWTHPMEGRNHHFFYNVHEVPVSALKNGDNIFTTCSDTEEHGLEVLWPGPALTIRFEK